MDIILDRVRKSYGEKQVLLHFSHRFPAGRTSCILGPSGCGKTTLLRLIASLEAPDSGEISGIAGQKNSAVFQENRLFENLTVERNLLLTACRGFARADALDLLDELGLSKEARKSVRSLSGGMQRRVAVARALAADYSLLLLDEPFTGLDAPTRKRTLETVARRSSGRTVLLVTHEISDAALLDAEILRL